VGDGKALKKPTGARVNLSAHVGSCEVLVLNSITEQSAQIDHLRTVFGLQDPLAVISSLLSYNLDLLYNVYKLAA
jgi:hypothetical protein